LGLKIKPKRNNTILRILKKGIEPKRENIGFMTIKKVMNAQKTD
jgi:hypothetical protein